MDYTLNIQAARLHPRAPDTESPVDRTGNSIVFKSTPDYSIIRAILDTLG